MRVIPLRILRHALARTIAVLESAEARVSMAIAREGDDWQREQARRELNRVTAWVRENGAGW